ncbi:MAG: winged helix-turn-helix domain-containing protein [Gammaproteobacteria bacterium]|nr:winged helix-turn-helix domain-containing protein [Gammaproteobacteria bacterium]
MSTRLSTPTALRRIALSHQGLLGTRRLGGGLPGMCKTLDRLRYVQIDTISVVARAHHHTFWSRVSGYREDGANRLIRRGEAFEYWAHALAFLPMRDYRFSLPVMNAYRRGEEKWVRSRDRRLMRAVLDRIREEGPLRVRDFEAPNRKGGQTWWNWKPAKGALEQLFMQGDLMSVGRDGLEKIYDLAERVLPADVVTVEPSIPELADHLVEMTLHAHGFAAARTFTQGIRYGGARSKETRAAVRGVLERGVRSGELATVDTPGGERFFGRADVLSKRPGKPAAVARILSPFDNSVIHRDRAREIFDFDFQFEAYVPEAKRRWGYFSLPVLFGDQFVGRMDCKAHRDVRRFEIKHLYVERPLPEAFDAAFAAAVWDYARLTGCDDVYVSAVTPAGDQPRIERCLTHTPST